MQIGLCIVELKCIHVKPPIDIDMYGMYSSRSRPKSPISAKFLGASATSIPQNVTMRPLSRTSNHLVSPVTSLANRSSTPAPIFRPPSRAASRPPSRGAASIRSANMHSATIPVTALLLPPGEVATQAMSTAPTIESVTDEDELRGATP